MADSVKKTGYKITLPESFESKLAQWTLDRMKSRRLVSREEILQEINEYIDWSGISPPWDNGTYQSTGFWEPGRHWWDCYYDDAKRRGQNVGRKKPQAFSKSRAVQECTEVIMDYFEKVEKALLPS